MHPNTHVNKAQSTNDTIPSATHLAVASELDRIIDPATSSPRRLRPSGTSSSCWQDALPHTLGEEFGGYAALMRRLAGKLRAVLPGCFEICMSGSAVGTGLGADPGYMDALYRHLSDIYGEEVRPTASLFDGLRKLHHAGQDQPDAFRDGDPDRPPGCRQRRRRLHGNDEGELDLNVWDATFYKCLFESMQLVGDELVILRRDCVEGIVACEDRCPAESESSIALSSVLATTFGYPEGVKVAHYCEEHGVTVKEAVLAMGLLNEADPDPILMTDPEAMARAIAEFRARIDG